MINNFVFTKVYKMNKIFICKSKVLQICCLIFIIIFQPADVNAQETLNVLKKELSRLADLSGGKMGIGVIHLETGRKIFINNNTRYPLASTYKVPIAVQLLKRVEKGEINLTDMTNVQPKDQHPGSGILSGLFVAPGIELSLRNQLELMMIISDNSATDICLSAAGGANQVTNLLKKNNIRNMSIDRPTIGIIGDWLGLELEGGVNSNKVMNEKYNDLSKEAMREASNKFEEDPRDTATPKAMAELLQMIWSNKILRKESSEILLDIMSRCQTGEDRLKGLLPTDTYVAHKTGTIGSTTNDVGIIRLPNNKGNIVVVAFVKDSELDIPVRERAIAHVSRAVHDYFLFN